ncbi:MAG: D-Ala-D-Ala carboxypeptidase family metallohydrolase [Flavobacteriaceae bacterium]
MNISEHISLKEAIRSNTAKRLGIDNNPDEDALANMKVIATTVFEPLRNYFNEPIYISSFYRSPELNKAIGGSTRSQHCKGEAIDIDDVYSKANNADFFNYIKDKLDFDQLIWEFGNDNNPDWVHVSYSLGQNRRRILKAVKQNGRTQYIDITNE